MNTVASLGHKVFPASRPPKASPREVQGHRTRRPGPHRRPAPAPCNVCQDGPACARRSGCPHTAGSARCLHALRGQGPAGRAQARARLASAPSWSGPQMRQGEARGRSAAALRRPTGRLGGGAHPPRAGPGQHIQGSQRLPGPQPLASLPPPPDNSGGFQAQTPRAATAAGAGTLTFARQLSSQATVLLGLPLRRNRLRKRSIRQSRSTRAPQSTGITPASEPAHQGRQTGQCRPMRTPVTQAARGEASAHNRPGKLHGNPPTSRLRVWPDQCSETQGFSKWGPWGPRGPPRTQDQLFFESRAHTQGGPAALPRPSPQTTAAGTGVDSRSQRARGHPVTGASSVHGHRGLKASPISERLSCAGDASPGDRSAWQGPGTRTRTGV